MNPDMIGVIPFDARRFRSAAQHYLAGRPAYPEKLITTVAALCDLPASGRVLDLGCGPGQLALAFASRAGSVIALDPEPEMLALCQTQVAAKGYSHVETRLGSSQDLDAGFGELDLVVIGRAFHWMDRLATLRQLDVLIKPGGAIALFGDQHPKLPANAWMDIFDEIVDRYAAADAGRSLRKSPAWIRHEAVLLDSAFCQLERHTVFATQELGFDRIVDRALSRSSTSSARLGKEADRMIAELRRHLFTDGIERPLTEIVEVEALIARRAV